jgi:hypothetical protein
MKSLNWPQATLDTTNRAFLVWASWYEYDLNIYSLNHIFTQPRFEKWGETELSKFMVYVKEMTEWSSLDRREYDEWSLTLWIKYTNEEGMQRSRTVFSRNDDESLYNNSSTDFAQEMLTNLENLLRDYWEGEWEISFRFNDPTYEVKVEKFGKGMCNA